MPSESWKQVVGYEGFYEVSNRGRVRNSCDRAHKGKLSEQQVMEIRSRYEAGGISQRALAAEYGVQQAVIGKVLRHGYRAFSKAGSLLSTNARINGYPYVRLHKDGEGNNQLVHRLVCEAFHGPSGGRECNHKNGQKDDNRAENLEWATRSENMLHSRRVLRQCVGEEHGNAHLTNEDVETIRSRYSLGGVTQADLAREFGVSQRQISRIVTRLQWKEHSDY